jgi:hypothetical protein
MKTAKAIDPVTRTLLAEFLVHNKQGKLLPGSYTKVDFLISTPSNHVILPVNTLLFRAEGLQVAMVDQSGHVRLKNVSVAVDYGTTVELREGVNPGDQIIVNPSDSVYAGEDVRVSTETEGKIVP